MNEQFRPNPVQFQRDVDALCRKIEAIAARAGVADTDCADLRDLMAGLPLTARNRVTLMLDAAHMQSEYDDPTLALASRYLLKLAQAIWEAKAEPHHATPPSSAGGSRRVIKIASH